MSFLTPGFVTRSVLTTLAAATVVIVVAAPAEAKSRKAVRAETTENPQVPARYKNSTLFPKGPVYFANTYLGDDPDPFIRFQLLREATTKFGGNE